MPPAKVAADVLTVQASTSLCGLQEIQVGEDTAVVRSHLRKHWELYGGHTTSPIILNSARWRVLEHAATRTPRPRLPRPENPFLDITSVVVESVKRPHLPPFAVVNTHLVSGGFNAQHLEAVKAQWIVEWGMFAGECHKLWRDGYTVLVLGDLNHPRPPEVRPRDHFAWLTPQGPPDHIGMLEQDGSVLLMGSVHQALPLNSDHRLHVVSGTLQPLG
jgi:endonuclease/exonuclease/phosphatase family metal-dependent hydrolase